MYGDGLGRFATEEYVPPSAGGCSNLFVHLTNYAINKTSDKFTADNESQFKRSLKDIYDYLAKAGHDIEDLKTQIKDMIIKTLLAV